MSKFFRLLVDTDTAGKGEINLGGNLTVAVPKRMSKQLSPTNWWF